MQQLTINKCVNCGGPHRSRNKVLRFTKKATIILRNAAQQKLTYAQAEHQFHADKKVIAIRKIKQSQKLPHKLPLSARKHRCTFNSNKHKHISNEKCVVLISVIVITVKRIFFTSMPEMVKLVTENIKNFYPNAVLPTTDTAMENINSCVDKNMHNFSNPSTIQTQSQEQQQHPRPIALDTASIKLHCYFTLSPHRCGSDHHIVHIHVGKNHHNALFINPFTKSDGAKLPHRYDLKQANWSNFMIQCKQTISNQIPKHTNPDACKSTH